MRQLTLTLVPLKAAPAALARVPLLSEEYKTNWVLKASCGAQGTVFLRYSSHGTLDVIAPTGKLLHRIREAGLTESAPEKRLMAQTMPRRGILLRWDNANGSYTSRYFAAFPDGLSGVCLVGELESEVKRPVWNGVGFVESSKRSLPAVASASAPTTLPSSRYGETSRAALAVFGGRRVLLRWAGERLEVWGVHGEHIASHLLESTFSADPSTGLSALWLDASRNRGPVLQARDSDSVYLHVFSDDLKTLLCVQHFSDASSSISATTVELGRDKRGILTVSESYSEREGGGHTTDYFWTGHHFKEK